MGQPELDPNCRKHPTHHQIPGAVCSSCLREKLSKLTDHHHLSSSSVIHHASSPDFPSPPKPGHRRIGSSAPFGGVISMGEGTMGLKKSKSVSFDPMRKRRKRGIEDEEGGDGSSFDDDDEGKEEKSGFWRRLIRSTSKVLMINKQKR